MTDTTPDTSPVSVGAIFRSSWGYEQTNIDYFEVVAATPKTVQLRPIKQRSVASSDDMSEYVEPVRGKFTGPAFRRKVQPYGTGMVAISSYQTARIWDGSPDHQTHWA